MKEFNDIKEENRNILSDEEDINLIKSLIGHECLVKDNDCKKEYEKIRIAGYADGIIAYYRQDDVDLTYVNRADFYMIVARMPDFGFNSKELKAL